MDVEFMANKAKIQELSGRNNSFGTTQVIHEEESQNGFKELAFSLIMTSTTSSAFPLLHTQYLPLKQQPRGDQSTPPPDQAGVTFATEGTEYSPTPGVDMSSQSSPGSASDHMGTLPTNGAPLYPGASVLAAFETNHVNRVITTTTKPSPLKPEANRRQKRLQRNRESARLSRRRRKQYLEVLEERVGKMATDLDESRRKHVSQAVATVNSKRVELVLQENTRNLPSLDTRLSRTSQELQVATTFLGQQLQSFSVSPSTKFILWLTLQTDEYFRGGRAASERLSAARIGERMLSSGTERAAPSPSMWPLFCNEIGVSYDQEEKVRSFQRVLLQDSNSWLGRHTACASRQVIQSGHDAVQALTVRAGQRETATNSVLSQEQRVKLMAWSTKNRDRVAQSTRHLPLPTHTRPVCQTQHVAANLYILNERMAKILETVPRAAPLVTGKVLKKLSRRPAFESLGARDGDAQLCRDNSFGSLKRSASEMSIDDAADKSTPAINPVDAQTCAAPTVQQALGFVQDLLPTPPVVPVAAAAAMPTMQFNAPFPPVPLPVPSFVYQAPAAMTQSTPVLPTHERKSSFLPAHLNVVPEEMWPADEADEFLLDMIEGDWAIGEGIDMDMMDMNS